MIVLFRSHFSVFGYGSCLFLVFAPSTFDSNLLEFEPIGTTIISAILVLCPHDLSTYSL